MRIYQYLFENKIVVAAAAGRGRAHVVPGVSSTLDLLERAHARKPSCILTAVTKQWERYGRPALPRGARGPIIPIYPAEVWGLGVTYMKSARDREADAAASADFYARAHRGPRPETFFKATAARCVGPGENIGIRGDSKLTAAEPELAYVVGRGGAIVAYTLCNDVSAWDIERENPLYLPQSKIYSACCALGPCLMTADALDPADVTISMTITRKGKTAFRGRAHTGLIRFPFRHLHKYMTAYNPLPVGTVVTTGTGIMTPAGFGLKPGDEVAIAAAPFGKLVNAARIL